MPHDVIVIGSGQAGVPLSKRLAAAGKRVLLVERSDLGGTCVNTGCTPTKTLIASALAAHVARGAARLGVRAGPVSVDLSAVVARKDAVVERWRRGVRAGLEGAGPRLEVARGHARFTGPREVEVEGERVVTHPVARERGLELLHAHAVLRCDALHRALHLGRVNAYAGILRAAAGRAR